MAEISQQKLSTKPACNSQWTPLFFALYTDEIGRNINQAGQTLEGVNSDNIEKLTWLAQNGCDVKLSLQSNNINTWGTIAECDSISILEDSYFTCVIAEPLREEIFGNTGVIDFLKDEITFAMFGDEVRLYKNRQVLDDNGESLSWSFEDRGGDIATDWRVDVFVRQ